MQRNALIDIFFTLILFFSFQTRRAASDRK